MLDSSNSVFVLMMTTMGESILVETLKSATYFISHSNKGLSAKHHITRSFIREAGNCYYFVQGTGLNCLIEYYHLDYDADSLRNSFNYLIRKLT